MLANLLLGGWLALRRRPELALQSVPEPRPEGLLIWLVATSKAQGLSAKLLSEALITGSDALNVLLSSPSEGDLALGLLRGPEPAQRRKAARGLLAHWRPDLIVYLGADLPPALVLEAEAAGVAQMAVGVALPKPRGLRRLWRRAELRLFAAMQSVYTEDHASALATLPTPPIFVGQITETPEPLPASESERAALSALLRIRPVWAAVCVPEGEEIFVLKAHRHALRHAHRTLLILLPQDPARGPALAELLVQEGWQVATRWLEGEPESETAVFIAEDADEIGLWYRLAPVSYFGGTLLGGAKPRSPLEAAALGSAILHGAQTAPFEAEYDRLSTALAARSVGDPNGLGEALADVLAPDRAAMLAHNAWAVTSGGAGVIQELCRAISDAVA